MASNLVMRWLLLVLGWGLLISESQAEIFRYDFETDLEHWGSYRDKWHWSDHDSLDTVLPASTDGGFAVMNTEYESDELYTPRFSVPSGANFTMSFYLRSEYVGSNTLKLFLINKTGHDGLFLDLNSYSMPNANKWVTVSKDIPPEEEFFLAIFCYNGAQAAASEYMRGCAIDYIVFETFGDQTTPTTVTTLPTSTAEPTDVTTLNPTEATTPKPTEEPQGNLVYDFQSSTNGWRLSLMNGASWKRVTFDDQGGPVGPPPQGPWVLQVFPELVQPGKVLAQSPLLEVTETKVKITVTFWLDGTFDYPSRLTVRRRYDFSTFDLQPVIDLSPFGDQQNQQWITYVAFIRESVVGEQYSLVLEGSSGGHPNNSVAVHRIEVEGAKEADVNSTSFFNFENGLSGWTPGSLNGGRWVLLNWTDTSPELEIPQPSDGTNFLFVQRYDILSGVISLESPTLELPPGDVRKLQVKFWMRGSVANPVALRFRVKGSGGNYAEVPFLNLEHYGDTEYHMWLQLQKEFYIPTESTDRHFQLVIEADLGSDMNNLVAVDDIRITSEII